MSNIRATMPPLESVRFQALAKITQGNDSYAMKIQVLAKKDALFLQAQAAFGLAASIIVYNQDQSFLYIPGRNEVYQDANKGLQKVFGAPIEVTQLLAQVLRQYPWLASHPSGQSKLGNKQVFDFAHGKETVSLVLAKSSCLLSGVKNAMGLGESISLGTVPRTYMQGALQFSFESASVKLRMQQVSENIEIDPEMFRFDLPDDATIKHF